MRIVLLMLGVVSGFAAAAVEIRVSPTGDDANAGTKSRPVRTLQRAVELARKVEREEVKEIVFADGFYPFSEPVKLGGDDYDFVLRAEHPGKAVLSGAVRLTGWRQDERDPRFLVADLPFVPEDGISYAMICGGEHRDFAFYPEKGRLAYKSTGGGNRTMLYYTDPSLPEKAGLADFDLTSVWIEVPQEWTTSRSLIARNDLDQGLIELKSGTEMEIGYYNQGFLICNARCGLHKPGLWMYEAKSRRVVYWPKDGETAKNLDCRIACARAILDVQYNYGLQVRGLVFEGCVSSFTRAKPYGTDPVLGAVFTFRARDMVMEDCEVRNCAAHGIFAVKPERCVFRNCHIHDVGNSALTCHDGGDHVVIEGCEVHDFGRAGVSGSGLYLQTYAVKCVGNRIHDGPGCGIVLWSTHSLVADNRIERVMLKSRDGGGLYGAYRFTEVRGNTVVDVPGWPGLYADEGSLHVVFHGNRLEGCWWPFHCNSTQYVTVSNNSMQANCRMRVSFQGGGHSVFCDNKLYMPEKIDSDPYVNNCDFWGRNEIFVGKQGKSYSKAGKLTLQRTKPKPGSIVSLYADGSKGIPIDAKGKGDTEVFRNYKVKDGSTEVGGDGFPLCGVPLAWIRTVYDDSYVYFSFERAYNRHMGYPGCKNFTSRGWGHCDANRVDFEGGKYLVAYPDGSLEASKDLAVTEDDVRIVWGGQGCVIRVPLDSLKVRNAKKAGVRLDLDTADDGLLLADDADVPKGRERKVPQDWDVSGLKIPFNASIWVEDMREEKFMYAPQPKNRATGVLEFARKGGAK